MTTLVLLRRLIGASSIETPEVLSAQREELQKDRAAIQQRLRLPRPRDTCQLCLHDAEINISSELAEDILYTLDLQMPEEAASSHMICMSCERQVCSMAKFKRRAHLAQWQLKQEHRLLLENTPSTLHDTEANDDVLEMISDNEKPDEEPPLTMKKWVCKKCKRKFLSQATRDEHVSEGWCQPVYPLPPRRVELHVCEACGKTCKSKVELKSHSVVHSTELKYVCDRCPYKTRWANALKLHTRRHNGERPLQCAHCPARFVTPSNLADHRRSHFPQYKCSVCERTFTTKPGLENHKVLQHSDNAKPHDCEFCGKSFATSNLLRRHQLKNHKVPRRPFGSIPLYIQFQEQTQQEQGSSANG